MTSLPVAFSGNTRFPGHATQPTLAVKALNDRKPPAAGLPIPKRMGTGTLSECATAEKVISVQIDKIELHWTETFVDAVPR